MDRLNLPSSASTVPSSSSPPVACGGAGGNGNCGPESVVGSPNYEASSTFLRAPSTSLPHNNTGDIACELTLLDVDDTL